MEKKSAKKKLRLKDILVLQAVIVTYTLSSVMAKLASGQEPFSAPFLFFYQKYSVLTTNFTTLP